MAVLNSPSQYFYKKSHINVNMYIIELKTCFGINRRSDNRLQAIFYTYR